MNKLINHLPGLYKDIKEIQEITQSEDVELSVFNGEMEKLTANQFIQTLTAEGIVYWEGVFEIIPNAQTESLDFRRDRVLNRITVQPPFNVWFLIHKLNTVIGQGKYTLYIDYGNYTIYIESSAQDQLWYHEIRTTVNTVKPCNMVYVNKPFTNKFINAANEILYSNKTYNYRLGTAWRLGQKSFASIEEKGVVKMSGISSINNNLLEHIAEFTAEDVARVVINQSVEISEFIVKNAEGRDVIIEYYVNPEQALEINNIRLYDNNDNLLDESALFIPVAETAVVKHIIRIREGV